MSRRPGKPEGAFFHAKNQQGLDGMATGKVKFYNAAKGFGFIVPDSGGDGDHFVHVSALMRSGLSTLQEGQRVTYSLEPSKKTGRLAAENIRAA